jgi:ribokinase
VIVVLGSINADLVLTVPRLPISGETIRATGLATYPGGKGANQAVAAARMGAEVQLVGRIGDDGAGRMLRDALETDGIDTSSVHIDPDAPTGSALITVADDGSNTIVTVGGANHRVGQRELDAVRAALDGASLLLVQLEIPMDAVIGAVQLAAQAGVAVMLDPAPVTQLPDELWSRLAWITPNEHEASALVGSSGMDAARALRDRGIANAVVTLGDRGCVYAGAEGELAVDAPKVDAIDTVACGDAFNGALAASVDAGADIPKALYIACAAGALAATRAGAYSSLPLAADVAEAVA